MMHAPDLLQNFINIFFLILLAKRIYPFAARRIQLREHWVVGLLFGLAGVLTMMMPISAGEGITVDLKAVMAGMSGLIGGPMAAVISFAGIGTYRAVLGGAGMLPGLVCIVSAALAGSVLHGLIRKKEHGMMKLWWVPVLFGWFIAVTQLLTTAMFPSGIQQELLRQFTFPLMLLYPVSAFVLHYFMNVDWIRYQQQLFDPITGLPRTALIQPVWRRKMKQGKPFALVLLNLERLRSVNDMHGVNAGNALLRESGERLLRNVPAGANVSRHDGHDFAVFLPSSDMLQTLIWLVEAKHKLSEPYPLEGSPYQATFSSGLAVYEGGKMSFEELVLHAETAIRHAMDKGLNQTVPYEDRLIEQFRYRTSLEKDLRFALGRNQLSLHYQPQYEIETGKLRGFEALLRWSHPDWGPISPAEFIPLAEETRLIIPIGDWVLETACQMAMKLNLNETGATIAVNISAVQLHEPDFPDKVKAILQKNGLKPAALELELTESTMVSSFETAADQLGRLKACGVRLALDDFGVGYSSLSYLRRLPFDVIKMDRSFIEDIGRSRDDRMTKSIIDWIRELRYGIVAEGLESYDQLYWLKQWKCDIAQGYLFSKPMKEEDLMHYLRQKISFSLSGLQTGAENLSS